MADGLSGRPTADVQGRASAGQVRASGAGGRPKKASGKECCSGCQHSLALSVYIDSVTMRATAHQLSHDDDSARLYERLCQSWAGLRLGALIRKHVSQYCVMLHPAFTFLFLTRAFARPGNDHSIFCRRSSQAGDVPTRTRRLRPAATKPPPRPSTPLLRILAASTLDWLRCGFLVPLPACRDLESIPVVALSRCEKHGGRSVCTVSKPGLLKPYRRFEAADKCGGCHAGGAKSTETSSSRPALISLIPMLCSHTPSIRRASSALLPDPSQVGLKLPHIST